MKTLITILLLTSSLITFGQDYASQSDNELKQRKKEAINKVLIGTAMMGASVPLKNLKVSEQAEETVDYAAGASAGIGGGLTAKGLVEWIEVGKEIKSRKKARKAKKD